MLEFKEYTSKEFIIQVLYNSEQIGTIQPNHNNKFYADFRKSEFYWFNEVLNNEEADFDLNYCKETIIDYFNDVANCFKDKKHENKHK
ncbi:MAG: hypothetical protein GY849_02635 [Deltaproteobacteria bacterium]|nr:hypothetical protein [Deltaproteobacteria bacterium]